MNLIGVGLGGNMRVFNGQVFAIYFNELIKPKYRLTPRLVASIALAEHAIPGWSAGRNKQAHI
jgi:hypothetical protein